MHWGYQLNSKRRKTQQTWVSLGVEPLLKKWSLKEDTGSYNAKLYLCLLFRANFSVKCIHLSNAKLLANLELSLTEKWVGKIRPEGDNNKSFTYLIYTVNFCRYMFKGLHEHFVSVTKQQISFFLHSTSFPKMPIQVNSGKFYFHLCFLTNSKSIFACLAFFRACSNSSFVSWSRPETSSSLQKNENRIHWYYELIEDHLDDWKSYFKVNIK